MTENVILPQDVAEKLLIEYSITAMLTDLSSCFKYTSYIDKVATDNISY